MAQTFGMNCNLSVSGPKIEGNKHGPRKTWFSSPFFWETELRYLAFESFFSNKICFFTLFNPMVVFINRHYNNFPRPRVTDFLICLLKRTSRVLPPPWHHAPRP